MQGPIYEFKLISLSPAKLASKNETNLSNNVLVNILLKLKFINYIYT